MRHRRRIDFEWYHWAIVVTLGGVGALPFDQITGYAVRFLGSTVVMFVLVLLVVTAIRRLHGDRTERDEF